MDNQHQMISGYRDLSKDEIDIMNLIKKAEVDLGNLWKSVMDADAGIFSADGRWMSIAKTHFEQGFSAFVRAVAKPEPRF